MFRRIVENLENKICKKKNFEWHCYYVNRKLKDELWKLIVPIINNYYFASNNTLIIRRKHNGNF